MSSSSSSSPTSPLLGRRGSFGRAAGLVRRASSRHLSPGSARVRESATEHIEERQSEWAYSRPIVAVDLIWNMAFVTAAVIVIYVSWGETPQVPLRLWLSGYAFQCLLHMLCLTLEFTRRRRRNEEERERNNLSLENGESTPFIQTDDDTSMAKHLESANTMFSFIWWIVGFYWVSAGGETLTSEAPQLYWLCIVFLAFDVFFVVICVAVACVIGIAVCCCLPCIIAILYAVADQEGATKEDVERLTKYQFKKIGEFEKQNGEIQESFGGIMTECDTDSPTEHVLSLEDAECCICLCPYDDGVELRELPCGHHFHSSCIDKWLYINATCPLCKLNILKNGNQSGSEEA